MPLPDGWSSKRDGGALKFWRVQTAEEAKRREVLNKKDAKAIAAAFVEKILFWKNKGSLVDSVVLDLTGLFSEEGSRLMTAFMAAAGDHNAKNPTKVPDSLRTEGTATSVTAAPAPEAAPVAAAPSEPTPESPPSAGDTDGLTLPSDVLNLGEETPPPPPPVPDTSAAPKAPSSSDPSDVPEISLELEPEKK